MYFFYINSASKTIINVYAETATGEEIVRTPVQEDPDHHAMEMEYVIRLLDHVHVTLTGVEINFVMNVPLAGMAKTAPSF